MDAKEKLIKVQKIVDEHTLLSSEIEFLLKEGENIIDKLQESERIFAITETINSIMKEMELLELEYEELITSNK